MKKILRFQYLNCDYLINISFEGRILVISTSDDYGISDSCQIRFANLFESLENRLAHFEPEKRKEVFDKINFYIETNDNFS